MQVSRHESSSGLSPPAGEEVSAGQARLQAEAQAGLLAGLRRKDKAALAMVIEQYSPMLTKAAGLQLGSSHDAEDAVQETFLAALSSKSACPYRRSIDGNGCDCTVIASIPSIAALSSRKDGELTA